MGGGGGGGGAIELVAHGVGDLVIASGAKISVNGGDTNDNNRGGGAGVSSAKGGASGTGNVA